MLPTNNTNRCVTEAITIMRRPISTLTAVLLWSSLMAQGHQNLLGFSLGPTFPTSDFGSKDLDNYSAGFANTGVIIDFTFSHYWENNIGFEAILRSQSNTQDVQSLANGLVARFPGDVVTVESSSWQLGGSLVGVGQRFALSEKVHFGTRLLAGILSATSPDMTIITEVANTNLTVWTHQNTSFASSFAFLIGFSIETDVTERMVFNTKVDYLGANPEFREVQYLGSDGSISIDTWRQKVGSLSIGFGLSWKL